MRPSDFYLGTHKVSWLWREEFRGVPLFVSRRALEVRRRPFPRAVTEWSLDSGGFTELSLHGRWVLGVDEYVALAERFSRELGSLRWAAPQDWMCEPVILAKTGLTVEEHQRRTVENLLELRSRGSSVRFIPVIQGWVLADYLRCVERYRAAGIDLASEPVVGLGTICRRQGTHEAERIIRTFHERGIRLHAFGAKTTGLRRYADVLASSDSLAWSFRARRDEPMPGCSHAACSNCPRFALAWREKILGVLGAAQQHAFVF